MPTDSPSTTEYVVLALLCEEPMHGFAVARQLEPQTDLGRILTVHRPLVYRAIDRLADGGLAQRKSAEPGDLGPMRRVVAATARGHHEVEAWLLTPVEHVRDLRIDLLVKLRLLERAGRDPTPLMAAQHQTLAERLQFLSDAETDNDVVDRWRRFSAEAALNFLRPK